MKLELIRRSHRSDYACYGVKISATKIWKIYIPTQVLRYKYDTGPAERFVAFVGMMDIDETKHICHTCKKTYPKFQYAKHAKKAH